MKKYYILKEIRVAREALRELSSFYFECKSKATREVILPITRELSKELREAKSLLVERRITMNKTKQFALILALSAGFKITKKEAIDAWNNGDVYIFDPDGIKQWYLDVIDYKGDWKPLLSEDIKNGYVIALDKNTYAMYM